MVRGAASTPSKQIWKPKILFRPVGDLSQLELNDTSITQLNDSFPILSKWIRAAQSSSTVTFDTGYDILSYIPGKKVTEGLLRVKERNPGVPPSSKEFEVPVYRKLIHCMSPYKWMKFGERITPNILGPGFWLSASSQISDSESMSYVDALASVLMNQFVSELKSPHFTRCFGLHRAVCKEYKYNLEDDFELFRFTKWFWNNLEQGWFTLIIREKSSGKELSADEIRNLCKPDEDFLRDSESDLDSDSEPDFDSDNFSEITLNHASSIHEEAELNSITSLETTSIPELVEIHRNQFTRRTQHEDSDSESETSEASFTDEYDVHVILPNMPVVVMYCEKMVNSLDVLLDDHKLIGSDTSVGTSEWTNVWTAWLFQICAALNQLQTCASLTHNDLHTNNIVWKNTEDTHIFYKNRDGTIFKVPTYGKLFQIIDYGRAIFTVQGQLVISSDHRDGEDAAGQYNFGPIEDPDLERVPPNRSFDLCRLACSLLNACFPVKPQEKKGGQILTKEDDWVVRETVNPLYNLLWTWLRDDDGKTVLETQDGDEKYPGFDLYSIIASSVHGANPDAQFKLPIFQQFKLNQSQQKNQGSVPLYIPLFF